MITPSQIRAARGLLRWNQGDLAERAGMSVPAIANIELEKQQPTIASLEKIEKALIRGGVKFGENNGVSMRTDAIFELHGQEGLKTLMDMIYEHCVQFPDSPVLVNNLRQHSYNEWAKDLIPENRARLAAIKDMTPWKILLHEDDATTSRPTAYSSIRYLPDNQFGSVGQYCFGNYLVLIEISEDCHITVINNPRLKDTWERMFHQLWLGASEI